MNLRRLCAVILLLALLLIAISACDSGKNPEVIPEIDEEEAEISFYGAECIFYTNWPQYYYNVSGAVPNLQIERTFDHVKEIELEYNMKFKFVTSSNISDIQNLSAIGQDVNIIDYSAANTYSLYKANLLAPLTDIPAIDIENFGGERMNRHGRFDGVPYGVTIMRDSFAALPELDGVVYFDMKDIREYSITSPYELYENKLWNWDTFEEILNGYSAPATQDTEAFYGLSYYSTDVLFTNAILANGGNYLSYENDRYNYILNASEAAYAMDWLYDLSTAGHLLQIGYEEFPEKNSLFYITESWVGNTISTQYGLMFILEDFSVMNFPTGPSGDYGTASAYINSARRLNAFPNFSTNLEPDETGFIWNELSKPYEIDGITYDWQYYASTMFGSEKGVDMYEFIVNNMSYAYSVELIDAQSSINSALNKAFKNGAAQEALSSIKDAVESTVNS